VEWAGRIMQGLRSQDDGRPLFRFGMSRGCLSYPSYPCCISIEHMH
jgi:hypothetical protein